MTFSRETLVNIALALLLLAIPLVALQLDSPFYVTLATRMAILALAARRAQSGARSRRARLVWPCRLLRRRRLCRQGFWQANAFSGQPLDFGLFQVAGTNQMPIIWLVALVTSGLLALVIGAISIRTTGVYFIMITLAFAQMTYYFAISWPAYGGEDGLSIFVRNGFPGINTLRPLSFFFLCYGVLLVVLVLFAVIRDFTIWRSAAGSTPERGARRVGWHRALSHTPGHLRSSPA